MKLTEIGTGNTSIDIITGIYLYLFSSTEATIGTF